MQSIKRSESQYIKPHIILRILIAILLFLSFLDIQSYFIYRNYQPVDGYIDNLKAHKSTNQRSGSRYSFTIHWENDGIEYEELVDHANYCPDENTETVWVNENNQAIARNPESYISIAIKEGILAIVFFIVSLILRRIHMSNHPDAYYINMTGSKRGEYAFYHAIIMAVASFAAAIFTLAVFVVTIISFIQGNGLDLEGCEVFVLSFVATVYCIFSTIRWKRKCN